MDKPVNRKTAIPLKQTTDKRLQTKNGNPLAHLLAINHSINNK